MSTRCQIQVQGLNVFIYIHSDGYPEEILPHLLPFTYNFWNKRKDDPEYYLARCTAFFAEQIPGVLGLGLSDEIHGDIEFLYFVGEDGGIEIKTPVGWGDAREWTTVLKLPLGSKAKEAIAEFKRLSEK